jgi:hypothetical protein
MKIDGFREWYLASPRFRNQAEHKRPLIVHENLKKWPTNGAGN